MFHQFSPFNHLRCPFFCRHPIAPKYPLFLLLSFFLFPSFAVAEVKEIVAEGAYNMGDGETPTVAESRALLQAKRVAIEQAGTYIESYSKVKNFQLTQDEIQVLASGVMEVTILDKKRTIVEDGIRFWVKINAKVSTDKIQEMARKVKEKSVVDDYKRLQQDYEKLAKELELFKKQLKEAKSDAEKRAVEAKISSSERLFQANEWFEIGEQRLKFKDRDGAFKAFSKAIEFNPNHVNAYLYRSAWYEGNGMYDEAIKDLTKIIEIDPTDPLSYSLRAGAYEMAQQFHKAWLDYQKSCDLGDQANCYRVNKYSTNKNNEEAYACVKHGVEFYQKRQFGEAIKEFTEAIKLSPNYSLAYSFRGLSYKKKGQTEKAKADFLKSCDLGNDHGCKELKTLSGNTR